MEGYPRGGCSSQGDDRTRQLEEARGGWVKADADGALSKVNGTGGGGAILRDNHGEFLVGCCHFFPSTHDAEVAGLMACRRALPLANELYVQRIILEIDSQVVARNLINEEKDFSANGQLVEEIKVLLESFPDFRVALVRRSANNVAHVLAK